MNMYKVHRRWLLMVTSFVCFTFCMVIFAPAEETIIVTYEDKNSRLYDSVTKKTRVVQAVFNINPQDSSPDIINRSSISFLHNYLLKEGKDASKKSARQRTSHRQTDTADDYYSDDDIIVEDSDDDEEMNDVNDDDSLENDVFAPGDFDYEESGFNFSEKDFKVTNYKRTNLQNQKDVLISEKSEKLQSFVPSERSKNSLFRLKLVEPFVKHSRKKSDFNYKVSFPENSIMDVRNITVKNFQGIPVVEGKIYWSKELEKLAPRGINDAEMHFLLHKLRHLKVLKVEPPTWNKCGRPKNQFIVFEDGSKACARYRSPHQYLIHGEILSFYLSRLLEIWNVPAVVLAETRLDRNQWSNKEVQTGLKKSQWLSNTTVALIQWIDNLERDKMPKLLLSSLLNKTILSANTQALQFQPYNKLVELLQWSDLIIFDYITGNYDRVASMQDAADKEKKTSILTETIHNLVKSRVSHGLWLIDNESGLLDSYSLLYGHGAQDYRFLNFHRQMLLSLCIFRHSTAQRVSWLHKSKKAGEILLNYVRKNEPLVFKIKEINTIFKRLQERIGEVYEHIEYCSKLKLR